MSASNHDESIAFLRSIQPDGPWTLTAIPADRPLSGRSTADEHEVRAFLLANDDAGLYYQPNRCRPPARAKATKADVVEASALHIDVDPPAVADLAELGQWQHATAERFQSDTYWQEIELPPPTVIVFSGSGFQCLWLLDKPPGLVVDGMQSAESIEQIEGRNLAILRRVDPDHEGTHNIDRLLRLPGTLNYPNALKRRKYKRDEPVLAVASADPTRRYAIDAFPYVTTQPRDALGRIEDWEQPSDEAPLSPDDRATMIKQLRGFRRDGDRKGQTFGAIATIFHSFGMGLEAGAPQLESWNRGCGEAHDLHALYRQIRRCSERKHDSQRGWRRSDLRPLAKIVRAPVDPKALDLALHAEMIAKRAPDLGPLALLPVETPVAAAPALTDEYVGEHYKVQRAKLARKTDAHARLEAERLRWALAGEMLKPEQLSEVAAVLVKHAPREATDSQLQALIWTPEPDKARDAIAAARAAHVEADTTASDFVLCQQTGAPIANSQRNIVLALDKLGIKFRHDDLADHDLMLVDEEIACATDVTVLRAAGRRVDDAGLASVRLLIDRTYHFNPPRDLFFDVMGDIARRDAFHPVRDYLDGLAWDGVPRIDRWLVDYAGAADTEIIRAESRLVLVAAVRRVRDPGCKFDEMLIIESPTQGTAKSTALSTLCPNPAWFGDNLALGGDMKLFMEATAGKWIIEAGELRGIGTRDVRDLKALLARQIDECRLSYGRCNTVRPRQCVIIGTTNDETYLRDPTGNRRFWPVRVRSFDIERLRADRDQLWAEAAHAEASEESIRLDPRLWADAGAEQAARRTDDPYRVLLEQVLGAAVGKLRIQDAWRICGFRGDLVPSQDQMARIGEAMRELGWERPENVRRFGKGERKYAYERGTEIERAQGLDLVPGKNTVKPAAGATP